MKYAVFPKVTRITVVGPEGTEYERYALYPDGAEVHLQDGGHTMKVFPRQDASTLDESTERELHHFEVEEENARLKAKLSEQALLIGQIRAARSNHPECTVHPEDDPVTCGWKLAVLDIDRALS